MHRNGYTVVVVAPAHGACLKCAQTTVTRAQVLHAQADRCCARYGLPLRKAQPPSRRTSIYHTEHKMIAFGASCRSLRVLTAQSSAYGWLQALRSCDTTLLRLTRLTHTHTHTHTHTITSCISQRTVVIMMPHVLPEVQ